MRSKKKVSDQVKCFTPTKRMYQASSYCLENNIKAYIVPVGKQCKVDLDFKGKIKKGETFYDSQIEASMVIWQLYEHIFNKLKKNS